MHAGLIARSQTSHERYYRGLEVEVHPCIHVDTNLACTDACLYEERPMQAG